MEKSKERIRKLFIGKRKSLSQFEVEQKSKLVISKLKDLEVYKKSKTILAYLNTQNEVITTDFISECIKEGRAVYLPVVLKEQNQLEFYRVFNVNTDIHLGKFRIYEPAANPNNRVGLEAIDVVIVPGIAFDTKKNRLGYGGGYYDRFLKDLAPEVTKIGLGFDLQIIDEIPVESFDISMNIVITEKRWYI
jgi:5-formyltetrahydrofolate cyclo-ligase